MSDKKGAPIKTKEDLEQFELTEFGLFYITFEGDALIFDNNITFTENEANRWFNKLLEELGEDYKNAPNLDVRRRVAEQIVSLKILPLRIH